jgi:hypothetical protein
VAEHEERGRDNGDVLLTISRICQVVCDVRLDLLKGHDAELTESREERNARNASELCGSTGYKRPSAKSFIAAAIRNRAPALAASSVSATRVASGISMGTELIASG